MAGFGWNLLSAAAIETTAVAAEPMTLGTKMAIVAAVAVGTFLLGMAIANWLRLPEFRARIIFVLLTLTVAIAVCVLDKSINRSSKAKERASPCERSTIGSKSSCPTPAPRST